ncbi:hypothetical protein AA0111_g10686 [Alternaria arborescens]|nr:hypothetical protein AA0111_g10686 [Alternaria arborescens]RYO18666.1 hypothetical protein AA0111_g10686 [Alternaria arborescens]
MSPLDDAVKPTPPIVPIFSPSSTPGPAVASKPIGNGPDADSDDKNKSDGDRQLLEKAMNHIINTKTLTRLCNLEGVDAVRIRDTLIKNYTDTCQRQAKPTASHPTKFCTTTFLPLYNKREMRVQVCLLMDTR